LKKIMSRKNWVCILFILAIGLVSMPAGVLGAVDVSGNKPARDTPPKLAEAWLRFHETDLCQNVDAVFIFDTSGMEVWFVYVDEENAIKMQELFKPLQDSYRIELYATRRQEQKKSDDDEDGPPPSVYLNSELRRRLEHVNIREPERPNLSPNEEARYKAQLAARDQVLDSRLTIFAKQILDWNRKAKRYAADLPLLAGTAFDSAAAPKIKSQAVKACKTHAQNLGKNISKLKASLTQALPRAAVKERSSKPGKPDTTAWNPAELAEQISEVGQSVAQRIYSFLYPKNHTVDANELRRPSLLDDLNSLEGMTLDFQKALSNLPQGKENPPGKDGGRRSVR
jgi:hypothetical protein